MTVILNYFPLLQTLYSTFTLTSARNFILEVWLIANTEFLYTPPSASSISNFIQIASVFPHVLSLFQNPFVLSHLRFSWLWQLLSFPVFKTLSFDYWLDSLQDVHHMGRPMSFSCLHGAYGVLGGRPQRQSPIFITSNQEYILWEHLLTRTLITSWVSGRFL